MNADFHPGQRIARLTPLADVLAMIGSDVKPVCPRELPIADAVGHVLATDVSVLADLPSVPVALRDGFALKSETIHDANAYSPLPLQHMPERIDAGDPLPAGTDTVALFDTIVVKAGKPQAISPSAPGEGVIPAGWDANARIPLFKAGQRLRASDVAALSACGIETVKVRAPRIRVLPATKNETARTSASLTADLATRSGAEVLYGGELEDALQADGADAIFAIGGTGRGRRDHAVESLIRCARLSAHGIGIMPGDTSAIGFTGSCPVLLLPGRIDAALSAWLLIGRWLIAALSAEMKPDAGFVARVTRKVTSTIGIVDVALVRRDGDSVEPLATSAWPVQAMTRADGWIAIPAHSEGCAAGSTVVVRPLS